MVTPKSQPAASSGGGVARLEELEEKRARYEALSRKLFTLPQRLRHPGLIPVGPRLYLPGELVRTNELTVLLGSCGDAAYFAERSAFQAQGIVQRRLAVVDERIKDVQVGEAELADALKAVGVREERVGEGMTEQRRDGDAKGEAVPGAKVNIGKGSVRKVKKRVSFREPLVTDILSPTSEKEFEAVGKETGKKAIGSSSSSTAGLSASKEGPRAVRSQFNEAVMRAQRQVLEDGVVNITEVYEDSSEGPSRVELPPGFKPDESVSFDDGSEDYLDLTGGNASKSEPEENASGDDFLKALLEAERDEELEQGRKETEVSSKSIRREEREFGKGFNKGFFGAPPVKATKPEPRAPAPEVEELPQRVERVEQPVVEERVVERRAPRKGARKTRKPRASSILAMRSIPSTQIIPDESRTGDLEVLSLADDGTVSDQPPVSKFRHIRKLQRGSAQPME